MIPGKLQTTPMTQTVPLQDLLERLASSSPGVRRLAVLDLVRRSEKDERATHALVNHLAQETDEKAALLIIRRCAAAGYTPAMPVLWKLYDNPRTPVRIALAAIVAHDELARPREHEVAV